MTRTAFVSKQSAIKTKNLQDTCECLHFASLQHFLFIIFVYYVYLFLVLLIMICKIKTLERTTCLCLPGTTHNDNIRVTTDAYYCNYINTPHAYKLRTSKTMLMTYMCAQGGIISTKYTLTQVIWIKVPER